MISYFKPKNFNATTAKVPATTNSEDAISIIKKTLAKPLTCPKAKISGNNRLSIGSQWIGLVIRVCIRRFDIFINCNTLQKER